MAYVRDSENDLVWDDDSGQYVPAVQQYTFTVNPTPNDASVTLTAAGFTQIGNSITVDDGTSVYYEVSKAGYVTDSDLVVITADTVLPVTLTPYVTITVNPTPVDATVTLTATGYVQSGNAITVPQNTTIGIVVSKTGYTQYSNDQYVATATTSVSVTLTQLFTLIISPYPNDATVTLSVVGHPEYTQSGNAITAPDGSTVSYTVSRTGYASETDTVAISAATTSTALPVTLTPNDYTLTVSPTMPIDAEVTLTAGGYSPVYGVGSQSITVAYGTSVHYEVSKAGYTSVPGDHTVVADDTISVSLNVSQYTVTIQPTPYDATVTLLSTGATQTGNSINVDYGASVNWQVSKAGYATKTGSFPNVTGNITEPVALEPSLLTFVLTPTPADATVVLLASGYTQSGNTITVDNGTTVTYSVSKTGYETVTGSLVVDENHASLTVNLAEIVRFTIVPDPLDATVSLSVSGHPEYVQVNNYIDIPAGSSVTYSVSKTDYITRTDTIVVSETRTLNVTLLTTYVTFTVNPTPNDATVTLTCAGATQSGNSISVANGSTVTWQVAKTNYVTRSGTAANLTTSRSISVELTEIVTLTIAPEPSDATVTLDVTGHPEYVQSGNTITVPAGTDVNYEVTKTGYVPRMGIFTVTSTRTEPVNLTSTSSTMNPLVTEPAGSPKQVYGNQTIDTDTIALMQEKISAYQGTSNAGRLLAVDTDGFVKLSNGDPTLAVNWGTITGTLASQTDLQNALNLKANDNAVVHTTNTDEEILGTKTFKNGSVHIKSTSDLFQNTNSSTYLRYRTTSNHDSAWIESLLNHNGSAVESGTSTLRLWAQSYTDNTFATNVTSVLDLVAKSNGTKYAALNSKTPNDITTSNHYVVTSDWANDATSGVNNIVHKSGDETIAGIKTFSSGIAGTAAAAYWADLAECYLSDEEYPVGTLICFGGSKDITAATVNCNGVISENPGFLLDSKLENSQPVALAGKTPVRVIGKIKKFDRIVLSDIPGVGKEQTTSDEKVIAIALEDNDYPEEKLVRCVTKFNLD